MVRVSHRAAGRATLTSGLSCPFRGGEAASPGTRPVLAFRNVAPHASLKAVVLPAVVGSGPLKRLPCAPQVRARARAPAALRGCIELG